MSTRTKYVFKPCSLCLTPEVCREVKDFDEARATWAEAQRRGLPYSLAVDEWTVPRHQPATVERKVATAYVCGTCDGQLRQDAERRRQLEPIELLVERSRPAFRREDRSPVNTVAVADATGVP